MIQLKLEGRQPGMLFVERTPAGQHGCGGCGGSATGGIHRAHGQNRQAPAEPRDLVGAGFLFRTRAGRRRRSSVRVRRCGHGAGKGCGFRGLREGDRLAAPELLFCDSPAQGREIPVRRFFRMLRAFRLLRRRLQEQMNRRRRRVRQRPGRGGGLRGRRWKRQGRRTGLQGQQVLRGPQSPWGRSAAWRRREECRELGRKELQPGRVDGRRGSDRLQRHRAQAGLGRPEPAGRRHQRAGRLRCGRRAVRAQANRGGRRRWKTRGGNRVGLKAERSREDKPGRAGRAEAAPRRPDAVQAVEKRRRRGAEGKTDGGRRSVVAFRTDGGRQRRLGEGLLSRSRVRQRRRAGFHPLGWIEIQPWSRDEDIRADPQVSHRIPAAVRSVQRCRLNRGRPAERRGRNRAWRTDSQFRMRNNDDELAPVQRIGLEGNGAGGAARACRQREKRLDGGIGFPDGLLRRTGFDSRRGFRENGRHRDRHEGLA